MSKILFLILFIFIRENNSYEFNDNSRQTKEKNFSSNISETFYLKYLYQTNFTLIDDILNYSLQVNLHSINCRIDVNFDGQILVQNDSEIFSLLLNSQNKSFIIKPLIDTIDGLHVENYGHKHCPLTINSYYINDTNQNLTIKNKEENFLFFDFDINKDKNIKNIFHLYYDKINILKDSFVAIYFRFEDVKLIINVSYIDNNKELYPPYVKTIQRSTVIYLNNTFLSNYNDGNGGTLSIDIIYEKNGDNDMYLFFKLMEDNNTSLLDRNDLNFGFITSKSKYQYYHAEILAEEEGELMLHNKRLYGKLYAKIVNKTDIGDTSNLDNPSIYPKGDEKETELEYNEHKLQIKFDFRNTSHCSQDWCHLLITYEQINPEENFPLIGYEYTILLRTWNCSDSVSKLIEIYSDEYIISCFDQGTSPDHYYFIQIPDDANEILIQLEGNYIEAFYEKGRKRINTWNMFGDYEEITVNNSKKAIVLNKTDIKGEYLSFLVSYDEYSNIMFSHYYFRIIFINEVDKYLPIDSNLGNLCLPKYNSTTEHYHCYLKLKNDYNVLNSNTNFAISTENQNEYVRINISVIDHNGIEIINNSTYFTYVYNENDTINNNVDYILFTFEFKNNETKNIISSFCDKIENIYPHIYSGQMYYLNKSKKINYLKFNEDYFLKYQFLYGESGLVHFHNLFNEFENINITQNFKGRPITIPLEKLNNFTFSTDNTKHILYAQLINYRVVKGAEEIKLRQPITQLLKKFTFPLYYYYNLEKKKYINIDVNIRFQKYMTLEKSANYSINGYLINKTVLLKKLREDNVQLGEPNKGNYSDAFGIGILQVNQKINYNNNNKDDRENYFLLIEINNLVKSDSFTNTLSIVEISLKEYDDNYKNAEYLLPINKYIIDTFDNSRDENKYCILKTQDEKIPIFIEISSEYDDIDIEFEDGKHKNENENMKEKVFKKYKINEETHGKINFKVKNTKNKSNKYLIKYSYYEKASINFDYNINPVKVYSSKETADYNLIFKNIKVNTLSELLKQKGTNFFITGTLYTTNDTSNTDGIISDFDSNYILNKKNSKYVDKTNIIYKFNDNENKEWTLEFKNLKRSKNYNYDLQLQIYAIHLDNFLNEEFLLYKTNIALEGLKLEEEKNLTWLWILLSIIGAVFLAVALFFIIKFARLKKRNDSFTQEMKSLLFSNDIQKNVLINERVLSKNESDFESTFI